MKAAGILVILAALAVTSGACAGIKGSTAVGVKGEELCVVENADVEQQFTEVMHGLIVKRGYATRFVKAISDCPVTMTFSATYARSRYGTVRVLKSSEFIVYRESRGIASVQYRYSHGMFGNGTVEEVVYSMFRTLLP